MPKKEYINQQPAYLISKASLCPFNYYVVVLSHCWSVLQDLKIRQRELAGRCVMCPGDSSIYSCHVKSTRQRRGAVGDMAEKNNDDEKFTIHDSYMATKFLDPDPHKENSRPYVRTSKYPLTDTTDT